jgi:hypothetical protein
MNIWSSHGSKSLVLLVFGPEVVDPVFKAGRILQQ